MDYKNIIPKHKVYSIINGERDYEADFAKVLSDSFNFLLKDFGMQLLISFCLIITFFVLPFLLPFIMGGWFIYIHRKRHGTYATFSDIFLGFRHFGPLAVLALVQTFIYAILIAIIGIFGYALYDMMGGINDEDVIGLFLIIGMLILAPFYYLIQVFFFFSTFLAIFSDMTVGEAMAASFSIGRKKFWNLFLIVFVSGLIAGLGTNFCYIGLLFTYPFGFIAYYIYFEQVFKIQQSGEDRDMDQILEHLV